MINKNSGQCLASQWVSGLREMSQAQKTSTEEAGDSSFDVWKSELLGAGVEKGFTCATLTDNLLLSSDFATPQLWDLGNMTSPNLRYIWKRQIMVHCFVAKIQLHYVRQSP